MDQEKTVFHPHIVQQPPEYSVCTGCMSCETICALAHDRVVSPSRTAIRLKVDSPKYMMHKILVCQHCEDAPCYHACPKKDKAMCLTDEGIAYINQEECIGCGLCAKACRFTPSRIFVTRRGKERLVRKCDLCYSLGRTPACIEGCPANCLTLSDLVADAAVTNKEEA